MRGSISEEALPDLAPPGAGIPLIERTVGRMMLRWGCLTTPRDAVVARFAVERRRILDLVAGCGPGRAGRRVLIPRLAGLEDSSRYWSVYMTVDHLRIVNLAIANTIRALGEGCVPETPASTAAVKPDATVDSGVVKEFERACDEVDAATARVSQLRTAVRYPHPWFGPLDAADWHFMSAFHLRLHRRQIAMIAHRLA